MLVPTQTNGLLGLVDGSSYLFRAFHALPLLTTSQGQPTGAVLGVANMVRRLLAEQPFTHLGMVFDAFGPTFRDRLYPAYKAHRPPTPPELLAQFEPLQALLTALGLPVLVFPDVEADDVIATLTRQAVSQGMATLIVSGDKDLAQLVGDHVTLLDTLKNVTLDRDGVIAKFGVPPERMVDYLTLVGDSVDNVPGVPGVGPKSAVKWLTDYGSLAQLHAAAGTIKGKVGEKLRGHLPSLALTQQLVTLRQDLVLPWTIADLERRPADKVALAAQLQQLEFGSWLQELLSDSPPELALTPPRPLRRYSVIATPQQRDDWLARLASAELFALDTETTSLDTQQARIVGLSFAVEAGEAAYLPLAHNYLGMPPQLDRDDTLARLRPLLEDPARGKLGHNLKYDMSVLANHGIALAGIRHDSMLQSYVLDSTATRHDLDSLALKFLGERTVHFEEVAGKGTNQISFDQVPIPQAGEYAAEDADITLRLHQQFWPRLQSEPLRRELYQDLEIPLIPVLSRMERHGLLVDVALLRAQSRELAQALGELERLCHQLAGLTFNPASPKQVQEVLFEHLKLTTQRTQRTPGGTLSTAETVLEELAENHELPRQILVFRSLAKLRSTYTERLPAQVNPLTKRVHTSFHQAVAATGRLSSSDPNLQNIPIRTPAGRRIRAAFIAPPGYRLLAADYSQIELRLMAHFSGDPGLTNAFHQGQDVHRATAAEVFGIPLHQVNDEQRRAAKAINFGLIYGMSAFGLAQQLGISRTNAQGYVTDYFARYPQVKCFMEDTRLFAREHGYVETLYGRRLYLPEINARNKQRREAAERTAINAPLQGSAADLIKRAMIDVDHWLQETKRDARLVLQVHDELVLEVAESEIAKVGEHIAHLMTRFIQLTVPLVVEVGVGKNWQEAHG